MKRTKTNYGWRVTGAVLLSALAAACHSGQTAVDFMQVEEVTGGRIPLTAAYDVHPDEEAARLLEPYKTAVDREMQRVVGEAAHTLKSYRPESPLSNLLTDIIRESVAARTGQPTDMAVMNIGGIRSLLEEGEITVGDIYQVCPFENNLAVAVLRGDVLLHLLEQIAACGGEGISGAELVITADGKLLQAKVGGRTVDSAREYRVATINYVVEGNDRMDAFKSASSVTQFADLLLRDVLIDYVVRCTEAGQQVDGRSDGRIVIDK